MSLRNAAAIVLLAMVSTLAAPTLAALASCPDAGEPDCCALDDLACVCCPHGPRVALIGVASGLGNVSCRALDSDVYPAPEDTIPRDILHVPRLSSVR